MKKYSKLIGSIVGGVLGFLVADNILPADFDVQGITEAVVLISAAIGTYAFPKNAE